MSKKWAEVLLLSVVIARGTAFAFSKVLLRTMGQFNILSIRFLLAAIILIFAFRKKLKEIDKKTIYGGGFIGLLFFLLMSCEMAAINRMDTGKVSFLECSAVVFVPIFEWILKKKFPNKADLLTSLIAFIGIGFITLGGGSFAFSSGDIFGLSAAVFYAGAIIAMDRYSKNSDPILVGILQVTTIGILSFIVSIFIKDFSIPSQKINILYTLYIAIVSTAFGYAFQPIAQKYTTSERAGLIAAISPLVANIIGFVFLKERLTIFTFIGGFLIIFAITYPIILRMINKNKITNYN